MDLLDRTTIGSVLFAGVLVVSMLAMGTVGGLAGPTDTPTTVDEDESADEDVEIDPALHRSDGTEVQVLVRLDRYDRSQGDVGQLDAETLQSHADRSQDDVRALAADSPGIEVENSFWIANAMLVTVDTSQHPLEELASVDGVKRLEANTMYSPPDPVEEGAVPTAENDSYTYGLEQLNAPTVWNEYGFDGSGARVAALDTGVDADHPDINLTEDGWAAFGSSGAKTGEEPNDAQGHGTHVSGTIAGGNSSGTAIGVAPDAALMHGKVFFEQDGSATATSASILGGMEWAVEQDADVMSMSLGSVVEDESVFDDTYVEPIENAHDQGTVVVASSGNNGPELTGSPGNMYSSFSIAANDENREIASFSSGEWIDTDEDWNESPSYWPDRYLVPDVSGPGVNVESAAAGGGYTTMSGTSMSAPHVAGQLALLVDANENLTIDQLEGTIRGTAEHPDGPDAEAGISFGQGIVNATAAVETVLDETGVRGTVTDGDGEPVERATVTIDDGSSFQTDATGEYVVMGEAGDVSVTADAFGYESNTTAATLESGNLTDLDFELDPEFDASLQSGQTAAIGIGDNVTVELEAANLEEYTLSLADSANVSADGLTATVNGEDVAFGEAVSPEMNESGSLSVTVETEAGVGEGDLVLDHELSGTNDSASYTTGPTELIEDPDPAYFNVTSYDTPRVIQSGDVFTATATVKNTGDLPSEEAVSHWIIDPLLNTFAEPTQLDPGEETTIEWSIGLEGIPAGEYSHGVFTETDGGYDGSLVVTEEPGMAIYDLEAPSIVEGGEQATVNATVERVGEGEQTQDIEFSANGSVEETETVTLDDTERQTVSFTYDVPENVSYKDLTIGSENSSASTTVVGESVAEHVAVIDDAQSVGELQALSEDADESAVADRIEDASRPNPDGVIEPTLPSSDASSDAEVEPYNTEALLGTLDSELPKHYVFDPVGSDALRTELDEGALSTYDRFVVNSFNGSDQLVEDFYDATAGDDRTTVLLDQWNQQSNAIADVSNATGDPASVSEADSIDGARPDIYYDVIRDHQLFDGIAEQGDEVTVHNAIYADMAWYDDYSGQTVAAVHNDGDDTLAGAAVGVDDDEREILLASLGFNGFMDSRYYTEDALGVLANAVSFDWSAEEDQPHFAVDVDEDATDEQVSPGDEIDVEATVTNEGEATATQTVELRVGEEVVDNATVTDLAPGTTDRVSLSYETPEDDEGTLTLDVASEDETDSVDVQVGDEPDRDYPVLLGDVTDTGEVGLSDVLAIQELSVGNDPGVPIVEERTDLDRDGDEQPDLADVLLAQERAVGVTDGPDLQPTNLDGPEELQSGEDLTASVEIRNAGDIGALDQGAVKIASNDTDFADGTTVRNPVIDVGLDETVTIEFTVDAGQFEPGEYEYGLVTDGGEATATVTVSE